VMLGGGGPYRGSSILVSGTAGTGKSTLAAQFCDAACARGERAIYFAFEESQEQIIRNMGSVGMDLGRWMQAGLLRFRCVRPSLFGLEAHLVSMQALIDEFEPAVVAIDPISDLAGSGRDVSSMLIRQVDFLKARNVTALFTTLASDGHREHSEQLIASLIDTCLLLRAMDGNGEHNRVLSVLKSRGMAHSNQVREFLLTDRGIELADVYVGPQGVLTGSARSAQEAKERTETQERQEDLQQRRANLDRRRESVQAEVAGLWREFADETDAVNRLLSRGTSGRDEKVEQRLEQGRLRSSDALLPGPQPEPETNEVTR
jgi:circadian clock protein KaiC